MHAAPEALLASSAKPSRESEERLRRREEELERRAREQTQQLEAEFTRRERELEERGREMEQRSKQLDPQTISQVHRAQSRGSESLRGLRTCGHAHLPHAGCHMRLPHAVATCGMRCGRLRSV